MASDMSNTIKTCSNARLFEFLRSLGPLSNGQEAALREIELRLFNAAALAVDVPSPPASNPAPATGPYTRTTLQIDVPSWISYVKVAESPDGSCALVFSRSAPTER